MSAVFLPANAGILLRQASCWIPPARNDVGCLGFCLRRDDVARVESSKSGRRIPQLFLAARCFVGEWEPGSLKLGVLRRIGSRRTLFRSRHTIKPRSGSVVFLGYGSSRPHVL